jgi:UDP-GlcNAc3NAcA epimerase
MQPILNPVGARLQFIKAIVVSCFIKQTDGIKEILLHTGEHIDANTAGIFFKQLGIPGPDIQWGIPGGSFEERLGRLVQYSQLIYGARRGSRLSAYALARGLVK